MTTINAINNLIAAATIFSSSCGGIGPYTDSNQERVNGLIEAIKSVITTLRLEEDYELGVWPNSGILCITPKGEEHKRRAEHGQTDT